MGYKGQPCVLQIVHTAALLRRIVERLPLHERKTEQVCSDAL